MSKLVYIAGPLFSDAERYYLELMVKELSSSSKLNPKTDFFLPHRDGGELGKGLPGAGFFALRSTAAVVPCAIIGPYQPFKTLRVVYGKPIKMDEYREKKISTDEMTEIIMEEISKLLKK